jgi:hypothetical protein
MRSALLFLGSAVALIGATPAGARASEAESRLIATFTAICLEHMGDAAAQTATATAAPWNFAPAEPIGGMNLVHYRAGSSHLGIGAATGSCTLTDVMESAVTLATMRAALAEAIGTDDGHPLDERTSRYWLIAGDGGEEQVLSVKVSNDTGRNLATLWVQRHATVSQHNQ